MQNIIRAVEKYSDTVLAGFKPRFASKEEFLKYRDSLNDSGDRIVYADGRAEIRL